MKSVKINKLGKDNLSKKEMNAIKGGGRLCRCGCHGPSSTYDNAMANYNGGEGGLESPGYSIDDTVVTETPNGPEMF